MSQLTLNIVLRTIFGDDLEWLASQLGENPFEVLFEDPERNLQFAYKFRSLGELVTQLIADRRKRDRDEPDLLGALIGARDKDTGLPMADRDIIDALAKSAVEAANLPAVSKKLVDLGIDPGKAMADELSAIIKGEQPLYQAAVKAAGIEP